MPAPLEANRRGVHQIPARRKYAKTKQSRLQYGRGRRRVHGTIGGVGFVFFSAIQNGGQFKAAAMFARRCEFDIFELRNRFVFASDLFEGTDVTAGIVANLGPGRSIRHVVANVEHLPRVCAQPSLQLASVDRMQGEQSSICGRPEAAGSQVPVSGTLYRGISDVSNASGEMFAIDLKLFFLIHFFL